MRKYIFENVLDHGVYVLNDGTGSVETVLEFYGTPNPQKGDKILIHESLLDNNSKLYTEPYAFELDDESKLKIIKERDDKDYIALKINDKNYVLKRIYG